MDRWVSMFLLLGLMQSMEIVDSGCATLNISGISSFLWFVVFAFKDALPIWYP